MSGSDVSRGRGRRRHGIVVVTAAAATGTLLVGAVLVRSSSAPSDRRQDSVVENRPSTSTEAERQADRHPRPTRDEGGAVRAAIASVGAAQQWFYMSDDELVAAVSAIATDDARERLVEENLTAVRRARESFSASAGRVWWVVRPLAWRVESSGGHRFRVAVWTVTVLSAVGVAVPQSTWSTVLVDLEWVDGGWRVDDMVDTPGPTPMTGPQDDPWNAEPFDTALNGFTRLATATPTATEPGLGPGPIAPMSQREPLR